MQLKVRYMFLVVLISIFLFIYQMLMHISNFMNLQRENIKDKLSERNSSLKSSGKTIDYKLRAFEKHQDSFENKLNKNVSYSISIEEFRRNPKLKTGNPLIDDYGNNDIRRSGEEGRGVILAGQKKKDVTASMSEYYVNVLASDLIPLNRLVPDSRSKKCKEISYSPDLPRTSVIVTFYNEWFSILLRTIYSIINRTPRHLVEEIIMVDDASTMTDLKDVLDLYIEGNFPKGLVKIIRSEKRGGLIKARMKGWKSSKGQVVAFLDSHMEVNVDWLQPLLTEIKRNRQTVAMSNHDRIIPETFEYFHTKELYRWGFTWDMIFFETFFRDDQIDYTGTSPLPGPISIGTGFAVDSSYFGEIGAYDEAMDIWGGENIELAWRVWMCGGRMVYLPCSFVGHILRPQPYSFPAGRKKTEMFNYKRAVEVWMDSSQKKFVYENFHGIEDIHVDVGDISDRIALRNKLGCKNFTWYIDNIWPELLIYDRNVFSWGSVQNIGTEQCLDNQHYRHQFLSPLHVYDCHHLLGSQGFSWTKNKLLKTTLQCVIVKDNRPYMENCESNTSETWIHKKNSYLKHEKTGLCLDLDKTGLVMNQCRRLSKTQKWRFHYYVL